MYPTFLNPAYVETFQLRNRKVEIPKCVVQFQKWKGAPLQESFGGKPVVSIDDKPMFAEVAIMQHFINDGWNARWTQMYGRKNREPICLTEWKDDKYTNQIHEPIADEKVAEMIHGIAKLNNNSYVGCWDVLTWKGEQTLFAKSKRNNKDLIDETHRKWLTAALAFGLSADNFLLVQWDFNPRCM